MNSSPSVAASEAWSAASSSIMDTRSEPPRCYGRQADKIMKRAATNAGAGSSPSSVSSKKQSSSSLNSKKSSKAPTPPGPLARRLSADSKSRSKVGRVGSSSQSVASIKSHASTATSEKTGRVSSKSKQSKTSSQPSSTSTSTKRTSSSKSNAKSKARAPSPKASSTGNSSSRSSSNDTNKNNSSKSSQRAQSKSAATTAHSSRDPESSITTYPQSADSNLALVPMAHPPVDPPSAGSTSGSSSSTEGGNAPTLYDPPSQSSSQNFAYAKVYQSNKGEQLAVLNEDGNEDESTSYFAKESRQDGITAASQSTRSSQTDSYYSDEEESEMDNRTNNQGSDLASAVQRALAIRDDNDRSVGRQSEARSEGTSTSGGSSHIDRALVVGEDVDDSTDAKDARALVQSDYHGGVNSFYGDNEGAGKQGAGAGGAIVEARGDDNNFLSAAVDNHHAIVPIDSAIYEAYDHTFVTCPENLRFRFLYTFLKKNLDKKVMIFFSTTNSVKYHAKLLEHFHIPVQTMHGKQKREKFISRFFKFSDLDEGILCATDAAGRDLDIPPSVDWVIQFEPPDDPSEYILRVARISCDSDRVGRSLLFLNPGEQGFLKYYHSASIPVSEFEIPKSLSDVQSNIEYHVNESERLLRYARDAYGSYLIAYASHGFRDVYNVHDLNKADVATAFGLVGLPNIGDDQTTETDTLVSSYVGSAIGGVELGETKRSNNSRRAGGKKTWDKKEKPKSKSWMQGEKSWPHSQIKLHPKFKQGTTEVEN